MSLGTETSSFGGLIAGSRISRRVYMKLWNCWRCFKHAKADISNTLKLPWQLTLGPGCQWKTSFWKFRALCIFSLRPSDCFEFPLLRCCPLHLPQKENTSWLGYPCLGVPSKQRKRIVLHSCHLSYQMWRCPKPWNPCVCEHTHYKPWDVLNLWEREGCMMSSGVPNIQWHRWTQ